MKIHTERFETVSDFLSHLDGIKLKPVDSHKKQEGKEAWSFYEFGTWEECQTALRQGWKDGIDAVNAKTARLESVIGASVLREAYNPAVTGAFFDVGLVCSGEPECWLQPADEEGGSKVVTIAVNSCISGSQSKKTIIERGAAVCALVKLLETQGKSVRLVYGMGFNVNADLRGDACRMELTLKREGDPLDIDALAFWLVCPDAFRRLCFRYIEGHLLWPRVGTCYGYPDKNWTPKADVQVPAILSGEQWTDERVQEWIKGILKAQGIALD